MQIWVHGNELIHHRKHLIRERFCNRKDIKSVSVISSILPSAAALAKTQKVLKKFKNIVTATTTTVSDLKQSNQLYIQLFMFCEFLLLKAFMCNALDITTDKLVRFWYWHFHHPIRSGKDQQKSCFYVLTSTIKRRKKKTKKKKKENKDLQAKKKSRGLLDKKLEESLPLNKVEHEV